MLSLSRHLDLFHRELLRNLMKRRYLKYALNEGLIISVPTILLLPKSGLRKFKLVYSSFLFLLVCLAFFLDDDNHSFEIPSISFLNIVA